MEQELLVMKNINKSFPGVHALRDVSLSLRRGEVHALIGENGAGKSTLMKVLSGVHQADSGEILWEGKPVQIHSTTEATAMGISIIYQELNLMPNMSIRENIFLGRENRKARFFVDFQKTSELAKTYTDMVGLTADVNTLVKDLSIAQRQMVEVAKALSTNAKLIVMDEPTSSLTDRETEILMNVIRNLRDQGVTVVFISHRLSELFEISDRITVLRDGECVGTIDTKDCTEPQLVNMMVGRTLDDIYPKGNAQIGEAVLEAKHLNAGKMVQDVSFTLHRGEILGFAGLIGAGRSEVMRAIFGVDPLDSGEIIIDGKKLEKHTPTDAIRAGLGLVPEDRKLLGLILDMSVRENTTLPCLPVEMKGGILSRKKENEITQTYKAAYVAGTEPDIVNLWSGTNLFSIADLLVDHKQYVSADDLQHITTFNECYMGFDESQALLGIPNVEAGKNICTFYYNKTIFNEVGIDLEANPIKTADDFETVLKKLQDAGYQPISCDDEGYGVMFCCFGLAWANAVGSDGMYNDSVGTTKFADDTTLIRVMELANDWYNKGYINQDYVTCTESLSNFLQGKAAIFGAGTWYMQDIADTLGAENVGVLGMCHLNDDDPYDYDSLGGNGQVFCISNHSEHPQEAADFISFLNSKEQIEKALRAEGLIKE